MKTEQETTMAASGNDPLSLFARVSVTPVNTYGCEILHMLAFMAGRDGDLIAISRYGNER